MHVLCAFQKYNYGDPNRGLSYETSNFIPTFEKLGYKVDLFDLGARAEYEDFRDLNLAFISYIFRNKPDIVFCAITYYEIWAETFELLKNCTDSIIINWTSDDSWRYESFSRYVAPFFHIITTTYPEAYRKYFRDGHPNVFLTQWAANPYNLQEPIPADKCSYKVSFIGTAHGNRKKWVAYLKKRGIHVECFGHGWENGPVESYEIPNIIRNSVISLNFSNSALSWEKPIPRRIKQTKARIFEVPGAGGFMLTEKSPGIERFYRIEDEIVTFESGSELVREIKYYLHNHEARDAIAWKGFERTRKENTYDIRLTELVDAALDIKKKLNIPASDASITRAFTEYIDAINAHSNSALLQLCSKGMRGLGKVIWGPERGPRAARRAVFEISWRLAGAKTYSASGLPGRMFYDAS
jgi:spore maturation protein CgeB